MAENKRSQGCLLGGCLLLLVVGGALAVVGVAGVGAWFLVRSEAPESVGLEAVPSLPEPAMDPLVDPDEPQLEAQAAAPPAPALDEAGAPTGSDARDLDAARSALEEANVDPEPPRATAHAAEPAPAGSSSQASPSGSSSPSGGASAPPPVAQPPAASAGSGQNVQVEGTASVVLVSSAGRVSVPGRVAPGRYQIEATFPGDQPVDVGNLTVAAGGSYTISCNARMGNCRAR